MANVLGPTIYKEKNTGKRYTLNLDAMRKADYNYRGIRLPIYTEPSEALLYCDGWKDDGEAYFAVEQKFLTEAK